jgi:hypothetical protein
MADDPTLQGRMRRLRKALVFYGWHALGGFARAWAWLVAAQERQTRWALLLWVLFIALALPYRAALGKLGSEPWTEGWSPTQRTVILGVLGTFYLTAFLADIWSDFQKEHQRSEQLGRQVTGFQEDIAKSTDAAKGAYISVGLVNPRISRKYDVKTGSRSGPVDGVDIRVASTRLIAGKDPLTIKAHLEIQLGSDAPIVMPLKFITWGTGNDIPTVLPEHTVPAGSASPLVMICEIKEPVASDAEAKLRWIQQSAKRVVVWDCLNPTRRVTVDVPGDARF